MPELKIRDKYNTGWHSLGGIGSAGPQGVEGNQGWQGTTGPQGVSGPQGPLGAVGPTGPAGEQGSTGNTGAEGDQGSLGATGPTGPAGDQGNVGNAGAEGDQGSVGADGVRGFQGVKGDVGIAGIVFKGAWNSGDTYDPGDAVTHDGTSYVCLLESTNNEPPNATYWQILAVQGTQGNVGDQGPAGVTGDKGDQGTTGSTGADGNQGPTGPTGPTGNKGDQGAVGSVGGDGPEGAVGATGPVGNQGATGVLGDALAHSVLIDAGGSFLIGSGTKDDNLNGVYLDDTEIVLQKDGADVLVMTAAGTFNFIVGSDDNLTVSSGGGILIEGGGDLTLKADDSNPGVIIFGGSSATSSFGPYSADGSIITLLPDTENVVSVWFGNTTNRLYQIQGWAYRNINFQTNYATNQSAHITMLALSSGSTTSLGAAYSASKHALIVIDASATEESIKFRGNVYPLTDSAYTNGKSDRYWSAIYGDNLHLDAYYWLRVDGGNPQIIMDTGDYMYYHRSLNRYYFIAGATEIAFIDVTGLWILDNCSALSFTDRSKEFVGSNALDQLKAIKPVLSSVKGDWAEVDHATLPEGVRSIAKAIVKGEDDEEGRDLGAYMSLISKAVQELSARMDASKIQ